MSTPALHISPSMARRFLLRRSALSGCSPALSIDHVVTRLQFVQMDSIPMLHRMHDLILFARLPAYVPEHLHDYLYTRRAGIEYYLPNLAIFPRQQLPLLKHAMKRYEERWGGAFRLTDSVEQQLASELLTHIRERGPTHPKQFRHASTTINPWGSRARTSTFVLEKLMMMGTLGVSHRTRFDRHYELLERLFPELPELPQTSAHPSRGLLRARAAGLFKPAPLLREGLEPHHILPVKIDGMSARYCILQEERQMLLESEGVFQPLEVRFLAPLDPVIYDRERTRGLFAFDYTWEVYVPPPKRKWGYYVLPILLGEALVGRLEAKPERKRQALELLSLSLEPGVSVEQVAFPIAQGLLKLCDWVGMSGIFSHHLKGEGLCAALQEAGCPIERAAPLA